MKPIQLFSRTALFLALMILSAYLQITLPTPFFFHAYYNAAFYLHCMWFLFAGILQRIMYGCVYSNWTSRTSGICQRRRNPIFDEAYIWFYSGLSFLQHGLFLFSSKKKSNKPERIFSHRSYRIVFVLFDGKCLLLLFISDFDADKNSLMAFLV